MEPSEYKVVALMNKKLPTGQVLNAIAHLGLGLCAAVGEEGRRILQFLDFEDADGSSHRSISARSLVVLQGSSNEIRTLRQAASVEGYSVVDFVQTMTGGDYASQLDRTKATLGADLEYFGVMVLGAAESLRPLTKKYSLWRRTDEA